ncbi:MAG: ATP-dependent DNA helicase [Candidatus Paceibacterota bacterium]|jgi:DNA helicase-2/ATP-dependent DNA helicase PcrA
MISKEFEIEYQKLNPKQKEAVDSIEGPVMVIAGPGTGKTTILTLRMANILRMTDTPPSGILALTFTEAGAKNMKTKLRETIGERALEVPVHTFHGFASSVITEFQDHFPHLAKSKQITDVEAETILRKILQQKKFNKLRPLGEPDFYLNKILGTISDAKGEAWTPEMLESFSREEIERIQTDPTALSTRGESKGNLKGESLKRIEKCERTILFAGVYREYEAQKRAERKIDFDDLIFELVQTLRQDQLLLQILQEKFLYILVDEHQDTNDSQNLIVRMIADFFESPNLFVVGDEKQAIYRFQGASVENFLQFQKIWSQMKIISLEDNYRSHQKILDASFKMIEQNYTEGEHQNLRIKLRNQNSETKSLDLWLAPDVATEEAHLVEALKDLTKKQSDQTIAIIVRKNSEVTRLLALLEENAIPASAERGANIFTNSTGVLFFDLLAFLADPSQTESLIHTFAGGLWGLDFAKQVEFIKLARSGSLKEIEEAIPEITELQKALKNSGAVAYLTLVADVSGFTQIASHNPLSAEVWRVIFELAKDLASTNQIEDPQKLIESLLAHQKTAEKKNIKIKSGQTDAPITIMTAHSSKGLEFDYVFLPYATEEAWVTKGRGTYFILPREKENTDDIRDDRRLFYVGLTRAKKHVCISYASDDGMGKGLSPLRFIDELDQNQILQTELKPISIDKPQQSLQKKASALEKEKTEYTKRVLLENGLSVTALNHFMECPNKFFYKSILKLPEAPSASSEKGNAMHEALSRVWQKRARGKLDADTISQIITKNVKEYLSKSLLPVFEKEAVSEELLINAPKVAEALLEHFNQEGVVSAESWVESYFEFKNVELKLHGKMDSIVENEKNILVFDYKTREAMSANAIKGETQGSDGNYFRQLVFYKMLLQSNHQYKSKTIEPALVFVKPDIKDRCPTINLPIQKSDIEKLKSEINSLIELVWSSKLLTTTCDDKNCEYCGRNKLTK